MSCFRLVSPLLLTCTNTGRQAGQLKLLQVGAICFIEQLTGPCRKAEKIKGRWTQLLFKKLLLLRFYDSLSLAAGLAARCDEPYSCQLHRLFGLCNGKVRPFLLTLERSFSLTSSYKLHKHTTALLSRLSVMQLNRTARPRS